MYLCRLCCFICCLCRLCCSVYCLYVNVYCHWVTTQLQLKNISYHISYRNISYHILYHISYLSYIISNPDETTRSACRLPAFPSKLTVSQLTQLLYFIAVCHCFRALRSDTVQSSPVIQHILCLQLGLLFG
jgi:hypothetical protein